MPDRRRATIFYGGFVHRGGGVVSHAQRLYDEMKRDGWDVRIVSLERLPLPFRYLPHLVSKAVNLLAAPLGLYLKGRLTRFLYRALFSRDEGLRIFEDIYLSWNSSTPSLTILHALWSDNLQALTLSPSAIRWLVETEERAIDAVAHPMITVSEPYRGSLMRSHGGSHRVREIDVVPLGLDLSQFASAGEGPRAAKSLVYCGNLESRKNLGLLLSVFRRLHAAGPDWRLTLIGDGPDRGQLEDYSRQHGLPVTFRGRIGRAEVIAELGRHAIYVHPSVKESFSFALLEAKMCSLKTIAHAELEVPREFIDIPVATFAEGDWQEAIEGAGQSARKALDAQNYSARRMMERTLQRALGTTAKKGAIER